MAEIKDVQSYRKRKKRNYFLRRIFTLLILVGFVFGIYTLTQQFNLFDIDALFSFFEESRFPIQNNAEQPKQIETMNNTLVFLTDKQLHLYKNSSGKETLNITHGYSRPQVAVSTQKALLYDMQGSRYQVLNSKGEEYNGTLTSKIYGGTIQKDGYYAFICDSSQYASELRVFDKYNVGIFRWSSTEKITAVSLAAYGRKCTVTTMSAEDGELKTTVYLLNFDSEKELMQASIKGSIALQIDYKNDNEILIIGDNATWSVNSKGDVSNLQQYDQSISFYSVSPTHNTFLVLGSSNLDTTTIILLDAKGNKIKEMVFEEKIISVDTSKNYFSVLTKSGVFVYNNNLDQISQKDYLTDAQNFAIINTQIYIVNYKEINKISIE